jgi:uncharacterized protein YabE (DUF348 family)
LNVRRRTVSAWQQAALALLALLGAIALMAAGYTSQLNAVRLVVDGQPRTIRTNQTTVEGVLRDAGLTIEAWDRVQPAVDAALGENDTIQVSRARPATIRADGRALAVHTHAQTPLELLAEQRITLNPNDALFVDGDPAGAGSPFTGSPTTPHTLSIRRAVPLAVNFKDGTSLTLQTTQPTIGQALNKAGIDLYLADRLTPDANTRVTSGASVFIERSIPVSVQVDGQSIRTRTHRERVGDVLAELGVALQGQDYTLPALDAPVQPDLAVRVVRVAETFLIEQEPIPFESQTLPDPAMLIDTQQLVQEGENGVLQKRIRVRFEDSQEVGRQVEDRTILRAPRPRITTYGTNIVVQTIQTLDGPREYWRKVRFYATSYSAATAGTPKTAPWYGITAIGWKMRKGVIAVDPAIIPFLSEIYVPGYGVGTAADTGGGVKGKWLDLGFDDDNLEVWAGWVDAYLLTPVPPPDQIAYILPNWPTFRDRGR